MRHHRKVCISGKAGRIDPPPPAREVLGFKLNIDASSGIFFLLKTYIHNEWRTIEIKEIPFKREWVGDMKKR